jgi:hypothetical protein
VRAQEGESSEPAEPAGRGRPAVGRADDGARSRRALEGCHAARALLRPVFIVAVAKAVEGLHGGLARGVVAESVLNFSLGFFALWWAWMNFTWFASAYDLDDIAYRLSMFVAMTGALILAAGLPITSIERDRRIAVLGYVVMRLALVSQWIRVARGDGPRRQTAKRFAIGVTACQIGWTVAAFTLPPGTWLAVGVPLGTVVELIVPVWAESAGRTPWHPEHIAERYGLFTIIVLGESVLAASLAIQSARTNGGLSAELVTVIVGGLLILFSMWWLYFDRPADRLLPSTHRVHLGLRPPAGLRVGRRAGGWSRLGRRRIRRPERARTERDGSSGGHPRGRLPAEHVAPVSDGARRGLPAIRPVGGRHSARARRVLVTVTGAAGGVAGLRAGRGQGGLEAEARGGR